MAELDEKLKQLLSDENRMKQVMEVASALLGKSKAPAPSGETGFSAPPANPPQENPPQADGAQANASSNSPPMSEMLTALLSQMGTSSDQAAPVAGDADNTTSSSVLPRLLQMMTSNSEKVNPERLNLVKAMKPYLAESRAASIDRAVRMANVAKAAKNALGLLGR